jgi:hypothetical protein
MKTKLIKKKNIKTSEEMLTLRLTRNLMNDLTTYALLCGNTRSDFCRKILQKFIDKHLSRTKDERRKYESKQLRTL